MAGATEEDWTDWVATQAPRSADPRDTYWFVGGPLDGRVRTRPAESVAPAVVKHVHLHEGPKIVHLYDLHEVAGHGGEYRLRE
ncbi:hypothetical protein [Pseudonocardia pini]|uniref:hypothetical protein n=1 Tax=Pseudonocardia pini TaxID=2758030 RepID=UPI0015F0BC86|nr:hypothetical protein [Pseudonocardia pini]